MEQRSSGRWGWIGAGVLALVAGAWWMRAPAAPQPAPDRREPRATSEPREPATPSRDASGAPAAGSPERIPPPRVVTAGDGGAGATGRAAVVLRAAWGSGADQLGRNLPREANPEAPMSVAVDPQGQLAVLDQVNNRIVRYGADGRPAGSTPLPVRAAQDLAFAPDGTTAVLDRLGDRAIALVGADGRARGTLPLVGRGITEGGAVTGVFVDGDAVYAEREHGPLVRIGRTDGTADESREEIPGRPTRDGLSYIAAMLVDAAAGRFALNSVDRATRQHRFTRVYEAGAAVRGILLLDTDRAGVIYTALLVQPFGDTSEPPQVGVRLLCVEPSHGRPLGQVALPANTGPEETFREFTALDAGGVLYVLRSDEGVAVQRVECP